MGAAKSKRRETCKRCNGEGDVPGYEWGGFPAMFTCKACDGKGYLLTPARIDADGKGGKP